VLIQEEAIDDFEASTRANIGELDARVLINRTSCQLGKRSAHAEANKEKSHQDPTALNIVGRSDRPALKVDGYESYEDE
jgi:hypothetical protein